MPSSPSWNQYSKDFINILEGFRYQHGIREVFSDWVEVAACAIHQEPYHLGLVIRDETFDIVEAQYMEAVKKYNKEELNAFANLLAITKMALGEGYGDFLGRTYMQLEISNDRSGEFFTPYPVSLMMARMTLADVAEQLQKKSFITVSEPASGAGGMLIALAEVLQEKGYQPSEAMFFEAVDVSKLCADMTYLQTGILGLSGMVRHGNTLTMESWSHRFTPICRIFPYRTNRFLDSLYTDPAEIPEPEQPPVAANDNELEQETSTPTPEATAEAEVLDRLSDLDQSYVQGRLF
ncbi:MAG: N-6 DNA methylase [Chloroflexota bacterium]